MSFQTYFWAVIKKSFHGSLRSLEVCEAVAAVILYSLSWKYKEAKDYLVLASIAISLLFVITFIFGLIIAAHSIQAETNKKAKEAEDKLIPRICFEVKTESHDGFFHRVRIRNLSDNIAICGVSIVEAEPPFDKFPLPYPLQITHQPDGQSNAAIPGGETMPVDVFRTYSDDTNIIRLEGSNHKEIMNKRQQKITLCAFSTNGTKVRQDFILAFKGKETHFFSTDAPLI